MTRTVNGTGHTAYFHGKGDAPFNAAKRMYCKGAADDPFLPGKVKMHSTVSKKTMQ